MDKGCKNLENNFRNEQMQFQLMRKGIDFPKHTLHQSVFPHLYSELPIFLD